MQCLTQRRKDGKGERRRGKGRSGEEVRRRGDEEKPGEKRFASGNYIRNVDIHHSLLLASFATWRLCVRRLR
jgi:hypothetical protein